jgi:Uma2 family endonuclease
MSIISTCKMTAEQFLQLGQDPPGVRLELVDGEVAVSPGPIPEHSFIEIVYYSWQSHLFKKARPSLW